MRSLAEISRNDLSPLITHPDYVDADLIDFSSFSVIRARDLQMLSTLLCARLDDLDIELTTYDQVCAN